MDKAYQRIKDFIYAPLFEGWCAFRVPTRKGAKTFHQCDRYPRHEIEGYRFCARHAEFLNQRSKDGEIG